MQIRKLMNLLKQHGARAGFTMIELLVVIAILGILAATVLAAINPIEQINRARDTRQQSDAAQLATSIQREYTSQQKWPWMISSSAAGSFTAPASTQPCGSTTALCNLNTGATAGLTSGSFAWGGAMEDTGELVKGFLERLSNQQASGDLLYVWKTADSAGVSQPVNICFVPRSFTYKQQAYNDCQAGKNPTSGLPTGVVPCVSGGTVNSNNMICLNGS